MLAGIAGDFQPLFKAYTNVKNFSYNMNYLSHAALNYMFIKLEMMM